MIKVSPQTSNNHSFDRPIDNSPWRRLGGVPLKERSKAPERRELILSGNIEEAKPIDHRNP